MWGGWQVLTEYNGSGVFKQWYAYGNYIDEVLAKGTTPFPVSAMFYIHDHLYSPAALTNFWGTVLERYEYDAYGSPTIWNADFTTERANSNYGNPYLFTGRRVDILDSGSLKIQYNRNRYYDYYSGRWLTQDPLGITPNCRKPNEFRPFGQYEDSMNLYEMMGSNLLMGSDPWGLLFFPPNPVRSCRGLSKFKSIRKLIGIAHGASMGWPIEGSNPHKHCVWNCRMSREKGRDFALEMGIIKEAIDLSIFLGAEQITDCEWKLFFGILGLRKIISSWVCSAFQESDIIDNIVGIECGETKKPCEQCCTDRGIGKETEEGTGTARPWGPFCTDRYKREMDKGK